MPHASATQIQQDVRLVGLALMVKLSWVLECLTYLCLNFYSIQRQEQRIWAESPNLCMTSSLLYQLTPNSYLVFLFRRSRIHHHHSPCTEVRSDCHQITRVKIYQNTACKTHNNNTLFFENVMYLLLLPVFSTSLLGNSLAVLKTSTSNDVTKCCQRQVEFYPSITDDDVEIFLSVLHYTCRH